MGNVFRDSEVKTVRFHDGNMELTFGLKKGAKDLFVGEMMKFGKNIIAKPTGLSVEWLEDFGKRASELLKPNGVIEFKTPLGNIFKFPHGDFKKLLKFIASNK